MKIEILAKLLFLLQFVYSHEPEESVAVDAKLSLPKLVDLNAAKQLMDWEFRGSADLNKGRLLLTPEKNGRNEGSIWNKNHKLSRSSFSVDYTVRAMGDTGKTSNGLAIWLLNDSQGNVEKLVRSDTSLYGGPSRFDGFAIVMDSNGPLGSTLRGYLNDNSKRFDSESEDFFKQDFGKCIIGYQNSQVPSTIRVSYDEFKHQFRVSIDNKLCFESTNIRVPEAENNFIIGVSAQSGAKGKSESFEIFKINVHESILPSEQKYNDIELAAQPVVITKNPDGSEKSRKVVVNTEQKKPDEVKKEKSIEAGTSSGSSSMVSLDPVLSKLNEIDNKFTKKIVEVLDKQREENVNLRNKLRDMSAHLDLLEKYLKDSDRKIQMLVLTEENKRREKESFRKEAMEKAKIEQKSTEKLFNRIKTFIYVLFILIAALGTFAYHLKNEIKHSKLAKLS